MIFEKDYYIGSTISAYEDYTKKDYQGLARELIDRLHVTFQDYILDYGCATGLLIRNLLDAGFANIMGTDISFWAVEYGRENYNLSYLNIQHFNRQLLESAFSYVLFLDVLEHIEMDELKSLFSLLNTKYIVVRIPLSLKEGERYVLDIHEKDKTHCQRHTKAWWDDFFKGYGFRPYLTFDGEFIYDSEGVLARTYIRGEP